MKVREVIPHTGPIPIVIPLRLFLNDINFPADNVTARVTWKFRGRGKVNLRSGPFLASPICSLMSSLAKIGPDQKSLKNSGCRPKFGRRNS